MTYEEAVAYLDSFVNYEQRHLVSAMRQVKLERMQRLCRALGQPQRRFRSILVTGTNGKGSLCALLYSMLRESGLSVGLYTSPHLEHLRERIRMTLAHPVVAFQDAQVIESAVSSDGFSRGEDWISPEAFACVIDQVKSVAEPMRQKGEEDTPTYFELLTAAAFLYFAQREVNIAILEVGLGGRLDATNVAEASIAVIGPIDLDHTDVLGEDIAAIAAEKAGIIKPRQMVISAPQHEEVEGVLKNACQERGAVLLRVGCDVTVSVHAHDWEGLQFCVTGLRGIYESLHLPLIGRHQAFNAAAAIAAIESLSSDGIPHRIIEKGLANVDWPGRLEVVQQAPLILMDGAHNPHAALALQETLMELCPGKTLQFLVGMSADKAIEQVAKMLGHLAVSVTCTKSAHPRAMDPTELAMRWYPYCHDVHVMSDSKDAYTYLLNVASSNDVVVVTGSLFLVGELRAAIRHSHIHPRRDLAAA